MVAVSLKNKALITSLADIGTWLDGLLSVARGASNAEIAEALFMGAGTVKTHVSHLLTKLDARDRAQLVVFAYESGFIRAGRDE